MVDRQTAQKWFVLLEDAEESVLHKTTDFKVVARKDSIEWTVVDDPIITNAPVEYGEVGLVGFDWNMFSDENIDEKSGHPYKYPFLALLKVLWPGNYTRQIQNMNNFIEKENKRKQEAGNRSKSTSAKKKINEIRGEQEFWVFIGILIYAGAIKKKGCQLWEHKQQNKPTYRTFSDRIDLGKNVMKEYRFKQLKAAFSHAFNNGKDEEDDAYHMVRLLIDGFNENRNRTINTSVEQVFDESMSAFRPRTTATGGLPNISFIQRKPEPLGVEYKVSEQWENRSIHSQCKFSPIDVVSRTWPVQKLASCFILRSKKERN